VETLVPADAEQQRYGSLVALEPDAILVTRNARVEFANSAALALFGAESSEALVGRSAFELFHPEDHPLIRERIRRLHAREVAVNPPVDLTVVRLDGSTRRVETAAAIFDDGGGAVIEVALRDVTERRRAEDALRANEERLRAHIDNSPLAVVEFDPAFTVTGWSREAERLFGWTAGEIVGRKIADLRWVHEDDVECVRRESARLLDGTGTRTMNVNRNYRKDGSIVHCEWYSSALHDADGRLTSILSQVLDVTARTRAEEELRRSEHALRDVDQRKTEFLAELSHELRNCLAPIKNGMRLLEHTTPGSPPFERAREIIRRQTDQVTTLVDDLLDISRIHVGKLRLERTVLDARVVVRRACEDVRPLFEERGLALRLDAPAEPVWIDADEARLTQVLSNLLANALKFTPPPGSVDVTLRPDHGSLALHVRDTGVGIEPRFLPSLFEPFTQERSRESVRGMGIGLALVKNLMTMHGGTVRAFSEGKGMGSEFVLSLPLAAAPAQRVSGSARAAIPSLAILLVEDNRDAAETLEQLLQLGGHRTRLAFDGRTGAEAFEESPPDVLISDIGLPDVSGHDLVRRLRDREQRPFFAIALSGYAQEDDVAKAKASGFDAHLPKPASLARLEALLAEAAGRLRIGGPAPFEQRA
jgi:two-component system CheB/CheR fusion protein